MNIKEQLIRDEGIRYKPYQCTANKLTLGVGRNIEDRGISHEEVLYLLDNDIHNCMSEVSSNLKWTDKLCDVRFAVLINMCFNLGINGLLKFRNMLAAVEISDFKTAAEEMLDSRWSTQVGDRAVRLAAQMETGKWV